MRILTVAALLLVPNLGYADELFQPKDGHFAIRFPGKPKENTQSVKTDVGTLKVHTSTYALPDGSIFIASFTEFPADAVKPEFRGTFFDGAVLGLKGKDGKVTSEKKIELGKDKIDGREVVIDKGRQQSRYRMVVKDNQLIQIGLVGSGEFATGKDATAYLDSFEFK